MSSKQANEDAPRRTGSITTLGMPIAFAFILFSIGAGLEYGYKAQFHQTLHWSRLFVIILTILYLFEWQWRSNGELGLWNGITTWKDRLSLFWGLVIMGIFVGLPEYMQGARMWLVTLFDVVGVVLFVLVLYLFGTKTIRHLLFQRTESGKTLDQL